jgi:hypothetical protein
MQTTTAMPLNICEITRLNAMLDLGMHPKRIAIALNRSLDDIHAAAEKLGRPVATRSGRRLLEAHDRAAARKFTRRPCLACQHPFNSEGAHNRLCRTCRQESGTVFTTLASFCP